MIQRKQSLFLLAACIFCLLSMCLPLGVFGGDGTPAATEYSLWISNGQGQRFFSSWPLFAIMLPTTVLEAYTIFMYHNRIVQARFCTFSIFLLVGWYIVFGAFGQLLGGEVSGMAFHPSWPAVFPALAIILLFMARQAILADEKLVRAADRIR